MRVAYPDGENVLLEIDLDIARICAELLKPNVRNVSQENDCVAVKGYWIIPSDGCGSPVMRIDVKVKTQNGMQMEQAPLLVERTEESEPIREKEKKG